MPANAGDFRADDEEVEFEFPAEIFLFLADVLELIGTIVPTWSAALFCNIAKEGLESLLALE